MNEVLSSIKSNPTPDLDTWKKTVPIPVERCNLKSLPQGTFGTGWFGDMVDEVSTSLETPSELAGLLGLGVVAAAVQSKLGIQVEPGYIEPLCLWVAVPMEPSNRKSSALKMMAGPLLDWEVRKAKELAPEIEKVISIRKSQAKVIEKLRRNLDKCPESEMAEAETKIAELERDMPKIPVAPRLTFQDCTPEELGVKMAAHKESMAYVDSESDSLFEMMQGKYSDSPSLDIYLKSWSGDPILVDRRSRESIRLNDPKLTLALAPQPSVIQKLSAKPALVQRGLLARFVFCLPSSRIGYRSLEPHQIPYHVREAYKAGIDYLIDLKGVNDIRLSREAYQTWKCWQHCVERMMRPDQRLSDSPLMAWGGKLPGNTARIAALLHCVEMAPHRIPYLVPVSNETMLRAVEMCRTLIDHAIAVHDLAGADDDFMRARAILDWLKRNSGDSNIISVRDMQQRLKQRIAFKKVENVRAGVRVLIELGYLLPLPDAGSGRSSEKYYIHPQVYSHAELN